MRLTTHFQTHSHMVRSPKPKDGSDENYSDKLADDANPQDDSDEDDEEENEESRVETHTEETITLERGYNPQLAFNRKINELLNSFEPNRALELMRDAHDSNSINGYKLGPEQRAHLEKRMEDLVKQLNPNDPELQALMRHKLNLPDPNAPAPIPGMAPAPAPTINGPALPVPSFNTGTGSSGGGFI